MASMPYSSANNMALTDSFLSTGPHIPPKAAVPKTHFDKYFDDCISLIYALPIRTKIFFLCTNNYCNFDYYQCFIDSLIYFAVLLTGTQNSNFSAFSKPYFYRLTCFYSCFRPFGKIVIAQWLRCSNAGFGKKGNTGIVDGFIF
ncbi:hypothetical protein D3C73_1028640 [compost metagenome]